jgi:hypothetical protein
MEDLLVFGLVAGLLFVALILAGKRLTNNSENKPRMALFAIQGRQLLGGGIIAGLASIAAHLLLKAKDRHDTTIFVQEPPF